MGSSFSLTFKTMAYLNREQIQIVHRIHAIMEAIIDKALTEGGLEWDYTFIFNQTTEGMQIFQYRITQNDKTISFGMCPLDNLAMFFNQESQRLKATYIDKKIQVIDITKKEPEPSSAEVIMQTLDKGAESIEATLNYQLLKDTRAYLNGMGNHIYDFEFIKNIPSQNDDLILYKVTRK